MTLTKKVTPEKQLNEIIGIIKQSDPHKGCIIIEFYGKDIFYESVGDRLKELGFTLAKTVEAVEVEPLIFVKLIVTISWERPVCI